MKARPIAARIAAYSSEPRGTGCVIWLGPVAKADGYPVLKVAGKNRKVARLILGLDDPKLFACHTCDQPLCVAREHLFVGTPRDNFDDMTRKGRAADPRLRGKRISEALKRNGHGTSQYRGVCWHRLKKKWQASIRISGKIKYLGRFDTEQEAAAAYNLAAKDCPKPTNYPKESR